MKPGQNFYDLTPDVVLDSVEWALDLENLNNRATGRTLALNSIENRVYEIYLEDGSSVVSKFYRPGRWTAEQIREEHDFSQDLESSEMPIAAPLKLKNFYLSETLGKTSDGIFFAVFPKKPGKSVDELSGEDLKVLGRFLARMHNIGARRTKRGFKRIVLSAKTHAVAPLEFLKKNNFITGPSLDRYFQIVESIVRIGEPKLSSLDYLQIHGDCHWGNILWVQGNPLFVDFDDTLLGPAVQDLWMIVGGREERDEKLRADLLEGYREFREFNEQEWECTEYLRALRIVHYSYWIARRWEDPAFPRMFPDFAGERWWQEEISALSDILFRLNEKFGS